MALILAQYGYIIRDGVIMIEGESKEASEDEILSAVQYAHEAIRDIIKFQKEFCSELSIEKREFDIPQIDADLETKTIENIEIMGVWARFLPYISYEGLQYCSWVR